MSWYIQDVIIPKAQETKGTGKIVGSVVEGTIYLSNKLNHQTQYSFQVLTDVIHIALSVSIVRSGDINRISAHNPCEMGQQITKDKIWHKPAGVLHKAVVALQ